MVFDLYSTYSGVPGFPEKNHPVHACVCGNPRCLTDSENATNITAFASVGKPRGCNLPHKQKKRLVVPTPRRIHATGTVYVYLHEWLMFMAIK